MKQLYNAFYDYTTSIFSIRFLIVILFEGEFRLLLGNRHIFNKGQIGYNEHTNTCRPVMITCLGRK